MAAAAAAAAYDGTVPLVLEDDLGGGWIEYDKLPFGPSTICPIGPEPG